VRRKDDEPEAIRNRLRTYHAQTAPVIGWYRQTGGPLKPIDATGTMDDVLARARKALGI
jgi:adenylate kinase